MTDVTPTKTRIVNNGHFEGYKVEWADIAYNASNISGVKYSNVNHSDRSIHVTGTFGGGTVKLYGSNDGTNWVALSNPQGDELSFTSAGLEAVLELTQYVRPTVTAGDGTTNLTVTMVFGGRK